MQTNDCNIHLLDACPYLSRALLIGTFLSWNKIICTICVSWSFLANVQSRKLEVWFKPGSTKTVNMPLFFNQHLFLCWSGILLMKRKANCLFLSTHFILASSLLSSVSNILKKKKKQKHKRDLLFQQNKAICNTEDTTYILIQLTRTGQISKRKLKC